MLPSNSVATRNTNIGRTIFTFWQRVAGWNTILWIIYRSTGVTALWDWKINIISCVLSVRQPFTISANKEEILAYKTRTKGNWTCPHCFETTPKGTKNDNTPININPNVTMRRSKRQALSTSPGNDNSPIKTTVAVTREEVRNIMDDTLEKHLSELMQKFNTNMHMLIDPELKSVRDELQEVKHSMHFMSQNFEEILKEHKKTQNQVRNLQERNNKL